MKPFTQTKEFLELHDRILKLEKPSKFNHGYKFTIGNDLCEVMGEPMWEPSTFREQSSFFPIRNGRWYYYILCKEQIFKMEEDDIRIDGKPL
jgi:hypothetical protein